MATDEKKRTLWIVSELYYPEMTSTGYYLTRTAEDMAAHFNVKVICGQPNYSARGTRADRYEIHNGVEIFRALGSTLNKNVILFRLVNMATLGIGMFLRAVASFRRRNIVLVVTTPPSMPFVTALAALIRGANYVPLIHDNYPEILFAVGKAKESSMLTSFIALMNRWLFKHAARIIVVGRDMKDLVSEKARGLDVPIDIIQNWAELETVEPRPRSENTLLQELGIVDKTVFLYAGNMGHPNDIETIVAAAEQLKARNDIHFIFLGSGVKRRWLEDSVRGRKLENVSVLEPRPRSEQAVFLNACDVAIVSLVSKMRGVSMPSRTYNILAAGKPILALTDERSELATVIDEDNVGWHIRPGNTNALLTVIDQILSSKKDLAEMSERARNSALTKYSAATASEKYLAALSQC